MTPFGIRKRFRTWLGTERTTDIVYHELTYILPDGTRQVVQAEDRYNLLMASQALPSPISTGRRAGGSCPDGKCGLCRVEIVDSTGLSPMDEYEMASMDDYAAGKTHEGRDRKPGPKRGPNSRLGCHTRIVGSGGVIQVPALFDYDSVKGEEVPGA